MMMWLTNIILCEVGVNFSTIETTLGLCIGTIGHLTFAYSSYLCWFVLVPPNAPQRVPHINKNSLKWSLVLARSHMTSNCT